MTFLFAACTFLLYKLEQVALSPRLSGNQKYEKTREYITGWFEEYRDEIRNDPRILRAVFATFLPGLRPDRVYAMREDTLAKVLGRCMGLGTTRQRTLDEWRTSIPSGDFSLAVEKVMREAEMSSGRLVTVDEIDLLLDKLAGRCMFSSAELRRKMGVYKKCETSELLRPVWLKLRSWEGKWLARCLLKNMAPVSMPEAFTLDAYHFLMSKVQAMRADLTKACNEIHSEELSMIPHQPPLRQRPRYLAGFAELIKPEVGVQLGRIEFVKAKSLNHTMKLANRRRMAMDRKYDGEYCQVHIDLSWGLRDCFRIFSKSGRDSTQDRIRITRPLRKALKLGEEGSVVKSKCILDGELVVFNSETKTFMPFNHLRCHVARAGRYIGLGEGAQRLPNTQLMIVLFDILLINDCSLLSEPHSSRMEWLRKTVTPIPGQCEFVQSTRIDFSLPGAWEILRAEFANGIRRNWEGFVLKACDEPYFDVGARRTWCHSMGHYGGTNAWIKLKKDYIKGCGDSEDFCIVGGASQGARSTVRLGVGSLTTFHAAVITNKDEIKNYGAKPRLMVVFEVSYNMDKEDLLYINQLAKHRAKAYMPGMQPDSYELEIPCQLQVTHMSHIFPTPLLFDVYGGGFDKPTDCSFYVLRHPRVAKIRWDRDFTEAVSYEKLQRLANEAVNEREGTSQEERLWLAKLERGDMGGQLEETPRSNTSEPTPQICRRPVSSTPEPSIRSRSVTRVNTVTPCPEVRNITSSVEKVAAAVDKLIVTPPTSSPPRLSRSLTFPAAGTLDRVPMPPSLVTSAAALAPSNPSPSQKQKQRQRVPERQPPAAPLPLTPAPTSPTSPSLPSSFLSGNRKRKRELEQPSTCSPLKDAEVYVIPTLMKFEFIIERLTDHETSVFDRLPLEKCEESLPSGFTPLTKEGGRRVVIVEPHRREVTKRVIRALDKCTLGGTWEVYDWRMLKKEPGEKVDWSVWKIWDV